MIIPSSFSDSDSFGSPRYSPSPTSGDGPSSIFDTKYNFKPLQYNNLLYDSETKIHYNDNCSIYIAHSNEPTPKYFALKASKLRGKIAKEAKNFELIGPHENIITYISTWTIRDVSYIQMELAEFGSIRPRVLHFDNHEIWRIFSHIVAAIAYMHEKSYMHLDISPANILQCRHPIVGTMYKLADFGTTIQVEAFRAHDEGAGPYVSPESLQYPNSEFKVTTATDIFSLGVVMLELTTHRYAPRVLPHYNDLRTGNFDLSNIPQEFGFVVQMLSPNPNERPTAHQLLSLEGVQKELNLLHPYVSL